MKPTLFILGTFGVLACACAAGWCFIRGHALAGCAALVIGGAFWCWCVNLAAAVANQGKPVWKCYLGNGEWDHDWQEKHDSSGEVDGGPGDHWSWRECRVCGEIEDSGASGTGVENGKPAQGPVS